MVGEQLKWSIKITIVRRENGLDMPLFNCLYENYNRESSLYYRALYSIVYVYLNLIQN